MTTTPHQPFIQPYLFFNGRCEEALAFYKQVMGAEVLFAMRFKENPEAMAPGTLPPGFEDKLMHATFRVGSSVLMASDGCSATPTVFDGFSLSLSLPTEAEANRVFAALAEGGSIRMPLTKTFWSPCFGMVADRFGIGWMVTVAAAS